MRSMKRALLVATLAVSALGVAGSPASATSRVPHSINYGRHLRYPSYGNSVSLGDCGVAAAADLEETLTHRVPNFSAVMSAYRTISPTNDGVAMADMFSYWQTTDIAGYRVSSVVNITTHSRSAIDAVIRAHHSLIAEVQIRTTLFGKYGLTIWGSRGSASGADHAVDVIGYTRGGLWVVSWGRKMVMSWAYWAKYRVNLWSVTLARR